MDSINAKVVNDIMDVLEGKSLKKIEEIKILVCLLEHGIREESLRDFSSSFSLCDGDSLDRIIKNLKNIYGENYD